MTDKLNLVTSLINNNKHKKALAIVKKYNSKLAAQSFISLEAEGICLFHLKKYVLAEIAFNRALALASNSTEMIQTLANLKASAYYSKNLTQSIDYHKQIIAIDPSINTAKYRFELCKLSFSVGDFNTVKKYVGKLTTLSEYSIKGGVLAIRAYAELSEHNMLSIALVKLLPEIDKLSAVQLGTLLLTLQKCSEMKVLHQIMALVNSKFLHEKWYQNFQAEVNAGEVRNTNIAKQLLTKPEQKIVGETKVIVDTITQLVTLLEQQGAMFHNEMYIIENSGNLSIHSFVQDTKKLMSIPIQCMPLVNDYQFSLEKKKIVCKPKKSLKNPFAAQSMELLIKLYNQTDKVNTWMKSHPFLALRHEPTFLPEFLSKLAKIPKFDKYLDLLAQDKEEALFFSTFFGSRQFGFNKKLLGKTNIKSDDISEPGLLTIADFINHSLSASGFGINEKSVMIEISAGNDKKPGEVFVKYNHIDFLYTYLIYGFVDKNCPILYSCTTNLTCLNGNTIQITSAASVASEKAAKTVLHLRSFIPGQIERLDNTIKVSSLIIPDKSAIHTLKQVLKHILLKCDVEGYYLDEKHLESEIIHLERQLIVNNLALWKQNKQLVNDLIIQSPEFSEICKNDLQLLTQCCVEHIENYMSQGKIVTI